MENGLYPRILFFFQDFPFSAENSHILKSTSLGALALIQWKPEEDTP